MLRYTFALQSNAPKKVTCSQHDSFMKSTAHATI
jgi:hypothetical protein